ncbi:MAG: aconitase X catalytic domain-containing protein [Vicinamibacterales bacterium]
MSASSWRVALDPDLDAPAIAGALGPAVRFAMTILVRMADVSRAPRLISIEGAHIDSSLYMGEATLEFAERLVDLGARVKVPSTSNVSGVDVHGWQRWAVPPEWARQAYRQMQAYQRMGCAPTWTCAPYQTSARPRFGQQIAWGESNAIAFANTVIGARTERYPDLMDICAAVTARVPDIGLHTDAGRAGRLSVRLREVPAALQRDAAFWPVLGHVVGGLAGGLVPVVEGLDVQPTEDDLKAYCAAAASSGSVALSHLVGVTPEAPTAREAFHGRAPVGRRVVDMSLLRDARRSLTTEPGDRVDLVVLGSPHFSVAEFATLAPLLAGRRRHPDVRLLVTTSRIVADLARETGALQALEAFGGEVTVDTCILTTPMLPSSIGSLMTNSAKYAYYAPGLLNARVAFGSLVDCVESAATGRVVRDDGPWQ